MRGIFQCQKERPLSFRKVSNLFSPCAFPPRIAAQDGGYRSLLTSPLSIFLTPLFR